MIRRSIQYATLSTRGMIRKGPGPFRPKYLPRRRTTAFSHWSATLNELASTMAMMPAQRVPQIVDAISWPERVQASHAPGMVMRKKMRVWIEDDFSIGHSLLFHPYKEIARRGTNGKDFL